eukprot:s7348_g2.t1
MAVSDRKQLLPDIPGFRLYPVAAGPSSCKALPPCAMLDQADALKRTSSLRFLRLMRWHRESELDNYKRVYNGSKVSVDDAEGIPSGKKLAKAIEEQHLRQQGAVEIRDHRIIDSQVDRLPSEMLVDFDMFVDIVDACRHEFVDQEKKKAGFTDDELQMYVDQFNKFDRDGSGSIEGKELLKLLEAFKWEPKSKQDREAFSRGGVRKLIKVL